MFYFVIINILILFYEFSFQIMITNEYMNNQYVVMKDEIYDNKQIVLSFLFTYFIYLIYLIYFYLFNLYLLI
jgi:hypothetical protein